MTYSFLLKTVVVAGTLAGRVPAAGSCWSRLVVRKLPRIRQSRILIMLDAILRPRQGGPQVPNLLYDVIRNFESSNPRKRPRSAGQTLGPISS